MVSVYTINWASVSKFLLISSSSVDSSDDMLFIFFFLFLLHFSHYYYILNNIHSLPLLNISRERTNFDAWGYWRFYSRYYRGRAYSLTNAWKLDFLPWNCCQNHVLSTKVIRNFFFTSIRFFEFSKKWYFGHSKRTFKPVYLENNCSHEKFSKLRKLGFRLFFTEIVAKKLFKSFLTYKSKKIKAKSVFSKFGPFRIFFFVDLDSLKTRRSARIAREAARGFSKFHNFRSMIQPFWFNRHIL